MENAENQCFMALDTLKLFVLVEFSYYHLSLNNYVQFRPFIELY